MLTGVKIYTSDKIWRQILSDLNATVLDAPNAIDVDFDNLRIKKIISPLELKSAILNAMDNSHIIAAVFKKGVSLPQLQSQIITCLYKTGGMTVDELKCALGYAPDASTHTVDTAIYQLRRAYGRDFIVNNDGVYSIGKL